MTARGLPAQGWRLHRAAEPRRGWPTALALVAAYALLSWVGANYGRDVIDQSAFWPANGVLVAALLVLPPRLAWGVMGASLALSFAANIVSGLSLYSNVVYTALNLFVSVGAATLTRRWCGAATDLSRLRRLFQFAAATGAAALAEAVIGYVLAPANAPLQGWTLFRTWFLVDWLGILICTPAVLMVIRQGRSVYLSSAGTAEKFALLAAAVAVTAIGFTYSALPLWLMIYPLLMLVAFRGGAPVMAVAVMVVAFTAIPLTVHGHGPIAAIAVKKPFQDQVLMQVFLASIFLCALPVSNALGELNLAAQSLRRREAATRAARARAEQAARAKTRFLAVMSHEIRTPLNGVIGFSRALKSEAGLSAEGRRKLDLVLSSSGVLGGLVDDILDFSKIEANRFEIFPVATDLKALAAEIADLARLAADEKGLTLALDDRLPAGAAHLADDRRVRQVLLNLLNNAVKFTPSGRIDVQLDATPGEDADVVSFRVVDTGIGVPEARRGELFQPFTQLDPEITRQYEGAGLGLAVSRSLVEMMGGEIGYEPDPGGGSAFWFRLPLARTTVEAAPGPAEEPEDERPLRVLVVDDHPTNREVAGLMLAAVGCDVGYAEDGFQAVEAARAGGWDIVLMDIHMPGMDGYAAARAIREMPAPVGRVPIVAVTADVTARSSVAEAGMDGHVAKPVNQAVLFQAMNDALAQAPDPANDVAAA